MVSTTVKVRVVCATKGSREQFFSNTLTGQSLIKFGSTSPCELRLFTNNKQGLCSVYNTAIDEAKTDPAVLVFIHDDVYIADYFWTDRVREGLQKFNVLGIAGNRRRIKNQPGWIMLNTQMQLDTKENLSGAIGQGNTFPPQRIDVFGEPGQACQLLDGVFLAADSTVLHNQGLRFDPQFTFHFYDMDFCRTAESLNVSMGTIPLSLVHASPGNINSVWHAAYQTYLNKWKE